MLGSTLLSKHLAHIFHKDIVANSKNSVPPQHLQQHSLHQQQLTEGQQLATAQYVTSKDGCASADAMA